MAVALVVVGSADRKGGGAMRWAALRKALSAYGPVTVKEIDCNRYDVCGEVCQASGERPAEPFNRTHYFDRASCARLADQLLPTGITTAIFSGLDTYRYAAYAAAHTQLRVVYDMHNVEGRLYRSIGAALPDADPRRNNYIEDNFQAIESWERTAIVAAHEVWTCSEEDRLITLAAYPEAGGKPIQVVPNAVDVTGRPPSRSEPPSRVCFTGRMDYLPNRMAATMLINEIAPLLGDLPVVIAGARLDGLSPPMSSNVRLVSDPQSTSDLIAGGIMAVPLIVGSGSRLKILEAFALDAPVVSTAKGVEGLEVKAGTHYLPAESPAEFATAIHSLATDARMRTELVLAARRLVTDRYSIPALRDRLRDTVVGAQR